MKLSLILSALLLLPAVARADTLDLGAHGKLSITPPKDWTYATQKMEDTGYTVTLSAPGNAKCVLTVIYVLSPEPLSKDRVNDEVSVACDQFVDASVEKKKTLQEFAIPGAYGAYCAFTDASMVGKPVQKDAFKVIAVGEIRLSDDLTASVSLLADDLKGADFQAMLGAVSSIKVTK